LALIDMLGAKLAGMIDTDHLGDVLDVRHAGRGRALAPPRRHAFRPERTIRMAPTPAIPNENNAL
jgi:hypothetical protein